MKKKRLIMMLAAVAAASAAMAQGNGQAGHPDGDKLFRSGNKIDLCNRCRNRSRWRRQSLPEVQFGRPRHE